MSIRRIGSVTSAQQAAQAEQNRIEAEMAKVDQTAMSRRLGIKLFGGPSPTVEHLKAPMPPTRRLYRKKEPTP